MKRALIIAAGIASALALPGCIIVDGSSSGSSYRGHGATTTAQLNTIVAANTNNRIGEPREVVLGRFPADHLSLVHSSRLDSGTDLAIYRVYARDKNRGTKFERYLAFENDQLALLTDDEDSIYENYGPKVQVD
jgi:hypothetical protein